MIFLNLSDNTYNGCNFLFKQKYMKIITHLIKRKNVLDCLYFYSLSRKNKIPTRKMVGM